MLWIWQYLVGSMGVVHGCVEVKEMVDTMDMAAFGRTYGCCAGVRD